MIYPVSLDHLVFRVADVKLSEPFYTTLLGAPVSLAEGFALYEVGATLSSSPPSPNPNPRPSTRTRSASITSPSPSPRSPSSKPSPPNSTPPTSNTAASQSTLTARRSTSGSTTPTDSESSSTCVPNKVESVLPKPAESPESNTHSPGIL